MHEILIISKLILSKISILYFDEFLSSSIFISYEIELTRHIRESKYCSVGGKKNKQNCQQQTEDFFLFYSSVKQDESVFNA